MTMHDDRPHPANSQEASPFARRCNIKDETGVLCPRPSVVFSTHYKQMVCLMHNAAGERLEHGEAHPTLAEALELKHKAKLGEAHRRGLITSGAALESARLRDRLNELVTVGEDALARLRDYEKGFAFTPAAAATIMVLEAVMDSAKADLK